MQFDINRVLFQFGETSLKSRRDCREILAQALVLPVEKRTSNQHVSFI